MTEPSGPRILIVDDTEASRYAVGRILRKARYIVLEAATGAEALRLVESEPDLIILDVNLPDMTGYEVCQRIKTTPATAYTPVLHLSASFVASEDRSEGLEGGADGYLTYPLEPRELLANVEALLRIRRAERAVRAQGELLRVTLTSIGDGVIATDMEGQITFINRVAQSLTGWNDEAVGKHLETVFHIVHEKTGEVAANPVFQVLKLGVTAGLANHTLLIARDGRRIPIDDTASAIRNEEGQFIGAILVFRDITERRNLESELQKRADALSERDRRKDEFLAMLAHELRNPLAPITNALKYLIRRFGDEPDFQPSGSVIERQVTHLARLVEDLMDVSRITKGKFELRKQRVALGGALLRAAELVRPFIEQRQHTFEVSLPEHDLQLEADPARLEQMLTNLLTNAAKYTPPGGRVKLESELQDGIAVIRVSDNGIGIRSEMMPRLFEMFQQADRVPGRVAEGLGLGLALVRNLAEMHGGGISANSRGPGKGSEFILRLPALPAESLPENESLSPARAGRPLRVLVTDDNVDSAVSMAMLLQLDGHEVRTAHDGLQALEVAQAFLPEIAFLDIGLPRGMDGYLLAQKLRQLAGLEKTILVAMTGYGQFEDMERSRVAGFDHHLIKPADLGVINTILASVH